MIEESVKTEEVAAEPAVETAPVDDGKLHKSWSFTEKFYGIVKKEVAHKISIDGKRFSHTTETKTATTTVHSRDDFSLDNVYSVKSYYSVARNVAATVILAIFAVLSAITSIIMFAADDDTAVVGIILLVLAAIFGIAAYFIYKRIKPTFVLEIDAVIPKGQLVNNGLRYGNYIDQNSKKALTIVLAILFLPIFIIVALVKPRGKYRFEMDEATGKDIVDTIGQYIIKD